MSVALVPGQLGQATALSVTVNFDGDWVALTAGNTVVIALVRVSGTGSLAVGDSSGNPYTVVDSGDVHLFYRRNVAGGETAVTITVTGTLAYNVFAAEMSGVSPSISVQSGTIGVVGSTTSHNCSTTGLTGTGFFVGALNAGALVDWTHGAGYSDGVGPTANGGPIQYKIGSGSADTGPITCSPATNIADGALLFLPEVPTASTDKPLGVVFRRGHRLSQRRRAA